MDVKTRLLKPILASLYIDFPGSSDFALIGRRIGEKSTEQSPLNTALHYLVSKGLVKEITPGGKTAFYKITASGIDKLQGKSLI